MARKIIVQFETELPKNATETQIQEWLEFELGQHGQMSEGNPLALCDIDAEVVSFN